MACLRLFTVPPLPPLPLFRLPRLSLCISRSTSLDALGEYFLAMRNPPQGMRDPLVKWVTRDTKSRTRKMKNKILAIPADAPAIPPNPKAAATRATSRNTRAQYSMVASPFPKRQIVLPLACWQPNKTKAAKFLFWTQCESSLCADDWRVGGCAWRGLGRGGKLFRGFERALLNAKEARHRRPC